MKRIYLALLFWALAFCCSFAEEQDIMVLKGSSIVEMVEKNGIFIKRMTDIEWVDDSLYLLDAENGQVIEVDMLKGEKVRTISRKGQGPGELLYPERIRVRNKKIFVLDSGNRALKIFDISGNFFGQFKPAAFNNRFFYRTFDVNQNDEIYFPDPDKSKGTLVGMYNVSGEKLRDLVPCPLNDEDELALANRSCFGIGLDPDGGFYLNFPLLRELWRCTNEGKVAWKKEIDNALLEKAPEKGGAIFTKSGSAGWTTFMRGMEIANDGKAVIGHFGGGCIVNRDGLMERVFELETWNSTEKIWNKVALVVYRINRGALINAALGQSFWLNMFQIEEKKNKTNITRKTIGVFPPLGLFIFCIS